jgi:hypothetical protein
MQPHTEPRNLESRNLMTGEKRICLREGRWHGRRILAIEESFGTKNMASECLMLVEE